MAEISSINAQSLNTAQSPFFAATQMASQQAALQSKKNEKIKKSAFSSALSKNHEISELVSEGLPAEIAGMSSADAIVFLKDALDIASEELKHRQNLESMENFRRKVSQFMKYIVKNNFEINREKLSEKMRFRISKRTGRPVDPKIQIRVIDQKINQLAREMLILNQKNLRLLAKLEEINGLIVDLLAE